MYLFDKPFTEEGKSQLVKEVEKQITELRCSKDKNEILQLVASIMDKLSLLAYNRNLQIDIKQKEKELYNYD